MKLRSSPLAAFGLVLLGPALLSAQSERHDVARFVPADSYAVLRLSGLRQGKIDAAQHRLVQFYHQRLRAPLEALLEQRTGHDFAGWREQGRAELRRIPGLELDEIAALLDGPIALALGRPTFAGEAIVPSMLLVADVQGREAETEALLQKIGQRLMRELRGLQQDRAEIAGVPFTRLWHTRAPGELYVAIRDGYLVVGLGRGFVAAAIECQRGERQDVTQQPAWQQSAQALPETSLLQAHLDLQPIGRSLAPWLPYELDDLARTLGIEALTGLSLACSRAPGGDLTVASIRAPGPVQGLLKRVFAQPLELKGAALVPANTLLYVGLRLDTEGLDAAFAEVMHSLPMMLQRQAQLFWQRELRPEIEQAMRELDRELQGLPWRQALEALRGAGPEFGFALLAPQGAQLTPAVMLTAMCEDAEGLAQQIEQLVGQIEEPRLRTMERHGAKIRYASLQRLTGHPLTPCFTVLDGQLLFASDHRSLVTWLGERAEGQKSLLEDPAFRTQWQQAPQASMLAVTRFDVMHTWMREHFGQVMSGASSFVGPELVDVLKDPKLGAALGMQFESYWVDEQGFHARTLSPIGPGSMWMVGSAGLDWFLKDAKIY